MNQLAETVEAMTVEVKGLRADLHDVAASLRRERFWRRVSGALVVAGFLSMLLFVSYSRQVECDRANRTRDDIRQTNIIGFATAWDQLADGDRDGRAALLAEITEDQARTLPPRDCSWPT